MPVIIFAIDPGDVTRERMRILTQAMRDTARHLIEMDDRELKVIGLGLQRSVEAMELEHCWEST